MKTGKQRSGSSIDYQSKCYYRDAIHINHGGLDGLLSRLKVYDKFRVKPATQIVDADSVEQKKILRSL